MAKPKFGLGRGLDALISGASEVIPSQQPTSVSEGNILKIALEQIIPNPRQPRKIFREDDPHLLELSESIKEYGLLQPLVVTRLDQLPTDHAPSTPAQDDWFGSNGSTPAAQDESVVKYQIIAGERRWRASRLAGLSEVPVVIKEVTPLEMLELALIENIQREDLNPIEEAHAYRRLADEFHLTQEQIADAVGKDRSSIANTVRLLRLPQEVRGNVASNALSMGHARAIVALTSESDQRRLARDVVSRGLSVRETEALVKKEIGTKPGDDKAKPAPPKKDVHTRAAEEQLRISLGTPVEIKRKGKGGTIAIAFTNENELQRLYEYLTEKK